MRAIEFLVRSQLLLRLWLLLLGLGVCSLLWNLLAWLLYPLLPADFGRIVGRAGITYGYRFFWFWARLVGVVRIESTALDALAREPGGMIIVANHPSMVDALAIAARLPRSFCIMKASLLRNPFLGAGARLARYIGNDSPHSMLRSIVANLRQGGQLILFPEGTRTVDGRLNRLRPGVNTIAQRAGVPIQTVLIAAESTYLAKGWPIWKLPSNPIVFRLWLGRRFEADVDHQALLARLEAYFRQELAHPASAQRASPDASSATNAAGAAGAAARSGK